MEVRRPIAIKLCAVTMKNEYLLSVSIGNVPNTGGIYLLEERGESKRGMVYVGMAAKNLRTRLRQHLIACDSSITTGNNATRLLPENLHAVDYWKRDLFPEGELNLGVWSPLDL